MQTLGKHFLLLKCFQKSLIPTQGDTSTVHLLGSAPPTRRKKELLEVLRKQWYHISEKVKD